MKYLLKGTLIILFAIVFAGCASNNNSIEFILQKRNPENGEIVITKKRIEPTKMAIIIIDMWNDHHCISAAHRVAEMAPSMNNVLKSARQKGILIIHSPSECMDFYKDTPQRHLAMNAPFVKAPVEFKRTPYDSTKEGYLEPKLLDSGCSCDTPEPCRADFKAWEREIETIEIAEEDAVSDNGQEVYNLLRQKGIDTVIIMGVHTNRCILNRPTGIRIMVYAGMNVLFCRDLTDSYHRDPGKHFEGRAKIIEHIEKYWCPTITSNQFAGGKPFRFKEDKTGQE